MRNLNYKVFFAVFFLLTFANSCSIEKKLHSSGYHIKFNKSLNLSERKDNQEVEFNEKEKITKVNENNALMASNDGLVDFSPSENDNNVRFEQEFEPYASSVVEPISSASKCDNIILKNGEEISAKVQEIEELKIRYKKCDNLEGPTYSLDKAKVFMIKYANGTKDVFKDPVENEPKIAEEVKTVENLQNTTSSSSSSTEPLSAASLVLAIAGLLISFFLSALIGVLLFILALIFGVIGVSKANQSNSGGKGAAITGIVIAIIGTFITLIVLAAV